MTSLPLLILPERHDEITTRLFLLNELDFLYEKGYRCLAIENHYRNMEYFDENYSDAKEDVQESLNFLEKSLKNAVQDSNFDLKKLYTKIRLSDEELEIIDIERLNDFWQKIDSEDIKAELHSRAGLYIDELGRFLREEVIKVAQNKGFEIVPLEKESHDIFKKYSSFKSAEELTVDLNEAINKYKEASFNFFRERNLEYHEVVRDLFNEQTRSAASDVLYKYYIYLRDTDMLEGLESLYNKNINTIVFGLGVHHFPNITSNLEEKNIEYLGICLQDKSAKINFAEEDRGATNWISNITSGYVSVKAPDPTTYVIKNIKLITIDVNQNNIYESLYIFENNINNIDSAKLKLEDVSNSYQNNSYIQVIPFNETFDLEVTKDYY
ncbi:MAG: hypothetical protein J0H68_04385 [Sphingobacteriia bacterium]|nr:hypothetical protein [Sphingobacteriia bacterium]